DMHRTRTSGFTLVELMVTIAIAAILAAIAFPSFQDSIRSNRVTTAANELMASLALARTEALRSPGGAAVCTSSDGASCGGTWEDGWIVWIDFDGDGALAGTNDRVLRYVQPRRGLVMSASWTGGESMSRQIGFYNRSRLDTHTRTVVLEPEDCPTGRAQRRTLDISLTGQMKVARGECE